jgi:hypothetical protein
MDESDEEEEMDESDKESDDEDEESIENGDVNEALRDAVEKALGDAAVKDDQEVKIAIF